MVAPQWLRDHPFISTHTSTSPRQPAEGFARRRPMRLTRSSGDRVIAGVCGGVARWLGVEPLVVRIAFVVVGLSGIGVVVYAVIWVAVPDDGGTRGLDSVHGAIPLGKEHSQRALAILLLGAGGLLLLRETGVWLGDRFVWPIALAGVGLGLAWPASSGALRRGLGVDEGRMALLRIGLGIAAVTSGLVYFAVANADWGQLGDVTLAVVLTIAGLLLIFGPWWWGLGRDLVEERRRRIRSEERAEMAARIHDSVLQTLALIQRRSGDPVEMARLARRQERELREWLFGTPPVEEAATVKGAMTRAAAEVEDLFGVAVEVVTVGDAPIDAATDALVAAAKEAMVNASKFAGVSAVDVYLEVEDATVRAFVRDRGAGFVPDDVPAGRQGIAESIRGRMVRHGGVAQVRSTPGEGTEVELEMPFSPVGTSR